MRVFHNDFIIGKDGVISHAPRGKGYDDALAIRLEDLDSDKLKNELWMRSGQWFHEGKSIPEIAQTQTQKIQHAIDRIVDIGVEWNIAAKIAGAAAYHYRQDQGKSEYEIAVLTQQCATLTPLEQIRFHQQQGVLNVLSPDLMLAGLKNIERGLSSYGATRKKLIENEVNHAFGADIIPALQPELAEIKAALVDDIHSDKAARLIQRKLEENLTELQQNPLHTLQTYSEKYANAHSSQGLAGLKKETAEAKKELEEAAKQIKPVVFKTLDSIGAATIMMPGSQLPNHSPIASERAVAVMRTHTREAPHGTASVAVPLIRVAQSSPDLTGTLLEEATHTMDLFGGYSANVRSELNGISDKVVQAICQPNGITPDTLEDTIEQMHSKGSDAQSAREQLARWGKTALNDIVQKKDLKFAAEQKYVADIMETVLNAHSTYSVLEKQFELRANLMMRMLQETNVSEQISFEKATDALGIGDTLTKALKELELRKPRTQTAHPEIAALENIVQIGGEKPAIDAGVKQRG